MRNFQSKVGVLIKQRFLHRLKHLFNDVEIYLIYVNVNCILHGGKKGFEHNYQSLVDNVDRQLIEC